MERRKVLGRLNWQLGEVVNTQVETERSKSLLLAVPNWMGHRPGQHVDVRLTAEDGYQTQRSYSIASPPEEAGRIALTVERLEDGEVSPYLVDELRIGDKLELRAPSAVISSGKLSWGSSGAYSGGFGHCAVNGDDSHRQMMGSTVATRLLYSSRSNEDSIYCDDIDRLIRDDRHWKSTIH